MQVSKTVKKYILSIEQETKEYFDETVKLISKRVEEEVLSTPLISSNLIICTIIENEIKNFINNIIALLDYYVDGVYNGGKMISRNKLKLKKPETFNGEKYNFNHSDLMFIERYKSIKLASLGNQLNKSIVSYLENFVNKKINGRWNFDGDDDYQNLEYKNQIVDANTIDKINDTIENCLTSIYDEFIELIVSEILVLFKRAQVEEYKNLGIEVVTFFADDDTLSCPFCTARSGNIVLIDKATDDFGIVDGIEHAFCKYTIDPVISYKNQLTSHNPFSDFSIHTEYTDFQHLDIHLDKEIQTKIDFEIADMKFVNVPIEIEYRINKLISKIQIHFKQFLNNKEFKFIDNIPNLEEWIDHVKLHYLSKGKNEFEAYNCAMLAQDNLKFKVSTFSIDNTIYISPMSLDSQPIENILVREIIKDKLKVDKEITKYYNEKKESKIVGHGTAIYKNQFISYLAEESPIDYLIESVICYINLPTKLEAIDKKMFDYIKTTIIKNNEQKESYNAE